MTNQIAIILEAAPQAPAWVRLLPLGEVPLMDGREPFEVDSAAVEEIIRQFKARGVDLVVDYEHQTMTGGKAPAAGWIKELKGESDGLWGRVEWTESARRYLESREYRYFSPVLRLDPETRRPTALLHLALTNTPAIANLDPLVAKALAGAGQKRQFNPADRDLQEETMKEELKKLLGIAGDKPDEEILALADARLKTALALPEIALAAGLEESATPAQVKGAILALKQGAEHLATLQGEVEALKAERQEEKALAAVGEALAAGKITPAQKDWAAGYARQDLDGFHAFAAQAPKVIPVGDEFRLPRDRGAGGSLPPDAPADQVLALKAQTLAREKNLDLVEATRQAWAENPDLVSRWKNELGSSH